jgi:bifunctional DNA-binding transcriptional regulator/antitoxin component of YhaV-PrlF toxin-antitoxin module
MLSDIRLSGGNMKTSKVGKRGSIVVPERLRRKLGIEVYTPERKAEFLLSNAVDAEDYAAALAEVRKSGVDPSKVPNHKPRKPVRR